MPKLERLQEDVYTYDVLDEMNTIIDGVNLTNDEIVNVKNAGIKREARTSTTSSVGGINTGVLFSERRIIGFTIISISDTEIYDLIISPIIIHNGIHYFYLKKNNGTAIPSKEVSYVYYYTDV